MIVGNGQNVSRNVEVFFTSYWKCICLSTYTISRVDEPSNSDSDFPFKSKLKSQGSTITANLMTKAICCVVWFGSLGEKDQQYQTTALKWLHKTPFLCILKRWVFKGIKKRKRGEKKTQHLSINWCQWPQRVRPQWRSKLIYCQVHERQCFPSPP